MAVSAVAVAGSLIAVTAGPASATHTDYGCPYGAVCLYNNADPNSGIQNGGVYWAYGPHNLSNQYGDHYVMNNQYDDAWVELCTGYNGTGRGTTIISAGWGFPQNLSPINSIVLGTGNNYPCSPP
ncbi:MULTISPECIES: hypothetical protein [unclassified Streptomyces]|uniref:hypothetical protein n=1 Tax=unclassified Streptomyces TaxID=2593676 RepID=UPI00224EC0E8|nr:MULTISPECIES: hypothetical protein [unclassified Streptomyces]MCX5329128.1 hypothetical protein [Streptomyces sp. NBC_00140]MCX5358541.1 hypothetical protein [Streptomyces sp. NBC_00124]